MTHAQIHTLPDNAMTCLVEARSVYGAILYYPANDTAKALAALAGKQTLNHTSAKHIRALGFTIMTVGSTVYPL